MVSRVALGGVALRGAPETFFVRRRGLRLAEREQQEAGQVLAELDLEPGAGGDVTRLEDAPDSGAIPEQTLTAPRSRCRFTRHRRRVHHTAGGRMDKRAPALFASFLR